MEHFDLTVKVKAWVFSNWALPTESEAQCNTVYFTVACWQVNCWSHHMLPCAPDTAYSALSWVQSISCSPGRDLLAALSMALTDRACHAVHVLCVELPDQPEAVLRALPALAGRRPVSFFYLQPLGRIHHSGVRIYLQCLTYATGGSCYMIPVGLNGELEKVRLTLLGLDGGQFNWEESIGHTDSGCRWFCHTKNRKSNACVCVQVIPLCVDESQSVAPGLCPVRCCSLTNTSSPLFRSVSEGFNTRPHSCSVTHMYCVCETQVQCG